MSAFLQLSSIGHIICFTIYLKKSIKKSACVCLVQHGRSALFAASLFGHTATVQALIDGGAQVDVQDEVRSRELKLGLALFGCESLHFLRHGYFHVGQEQI